jgi:hypothetical protein
VGRNLDTSAKSRTGGRGEARRGLAVETKTAHDPTMGRPKGILETVAAADRHADRPRWGMSLLAGLIVALTLPGAASAGLGGVRAAHNAYDEGRHDTADAVFAEALDLGFTNVELDIVLADGRLEVRHDCSAPRATRPLAAYLDDLAGRVRDHGGSVYGDGREFVLTIDVKDCPGPDVWAVAELLDGLLHDHAGMLSAAAPGDDGPYRRGAVTVCLSGDDSAKRAFRTRVADHGGRLLAFADHVIGGGDEPTDDPTALLPDAADGFVRFLSIHWRHIEPGFAGGEGAWTDDDRTRLEVVIETAAARGFHVRFYTLNGEAEDHRLAGGLPAARERWLAVARAAAVSPLPHWVATDDRRAISRLLHGS